MKRLLPVVVALVVVLAVVAVLTFAVTRDTGGADAYTVNGESVSQRTINSELALLSENDLLQANGSGSVDSSGAASWLTTRIRGAGILELMKRNDLRITSADRSQLRQQLPEGVDQLSEATQDLLIGYTGGGQLLVDKLGEDAANEALQQIVRKYDVSVDPKYGRWVRSQLQVCPISGCVAAQPATGG